MVEVSLAVCGHYSYTKNFEIQEGRKREGVVGQIGREKAQVFLNQKCQKKKCHFPEAFTIYL